MLVLKKFYADWCGPCKMLTPVVTSVVESLGSDVVTLENVNIDVETAMAESANVTSIPVMILYRDGVEVDRFMGAAPANKVKEFIEKNI